MEKFTKFTRLVSRYWQALRSSKVPRDGSRRYMHDIWQPLTLLVLMIGFTAAFYATHSSYASTNPNELVFCNADGNVDETVKGYRPFWDPGLYFTINIAFGRFSFSTVKVIDAIWDVLVGRGGQTLAAVIAYCVLRRSLTLTLERYTITMPTVASLYCQQIQVMPVIRLTYSAFRQWDFQRQTWRQPCHTGRLRLVAQVFVCIYVLSFATLVSVMTGYRAQLTGYFGYNAQYTSELVPISELRIPRLALFDATRIGFPGDLIVATDAIPYPPYTSEIPHDYIAFSARDFLASSRHFEEPYGTLLDYYYACMAVLKETAPGSTKHTLNHNFDCAFHNCSCSIAANVQLSPCIGYDYEGYKACMNNAIWAAMTSTIVINGTRWEPSPALDITTEVSSWWNPWNGDSEYDTRNTSDYWTNATAYIFPPHSYSDWQSKDRFRVYAHNSTVFNESTIRETGRCVAEDAYSWGFSSLLLLTFCLYTVLFAMTLVLLQTDVYWNSRHDRIHQSHSVYTDVLYLADELRARFGSTLGGHAQPPTKVEKMVEQAKHGLNIDVSELPLSRWQEWRLSRKAKSSKLSTRGRILSKILPLARRSGDSLGHKVRRLSSNGSTQPAQSDTEDRTLESEASLTSRLEAADPRSSSDRNAPVHAVVDTPGSSMLEEQRLIASTTYEGT